MLYKIILKTIGSLNSSLDTFNNKNDYHDKSSIA